jgi:acyl dehydratase
MPTRIVKDVAELTALVGQPLGVSDWLEMTQERVDQFAAATDDRQWIHCDPGRAERESPYGTTIAHGFLTLSMCVALLEETFAIEGAGMIINYGLNRVRFPSAVRVGARIRLALKLLHTKELSDSLEADFHCTVEIEGESKPACVAEWLLRIYR